MIKGLYPIIDNTTAPHLTHLEIAKAFLQGGAKVLQLRMKRASRDQVLDVARKIVELKKQRDFIFIVNDHLEVAKELNSDGYHGGIGDPSIEEARSLLGDKKIIGFSSHSLNEAMEAEKRGASYVAFGAIFPSPSKDHDHPIQGIDKLRTVVSTLKVPVVALGGIGRDNIKEVLSTGVVSVAMISGLIQAKIIADETKFYTRLLG